MTSKIVAFILGIAIGAGVCVAVLSGKARKETVAAVDATANSLSNKLSEVEASLASAKSRLQQAEQNNDKLTARVQELMKQQATAAAQPAPAAETKPKGFAALFGGDGTNGMSEAMSSMMKTAMEGQIEGRVSGMKAKLNLTPTQEATIRSILQKQMGMGTDVAQKMLKGELSKEDMAEMTRNQPNYEDQIKALLTTEQKAGYEEYQNEEHSRNARLMANSELMQMQSQLQLNEEQQDKVFAILADQVLKQFDGSTKDPAQAMDFRGQAEKKAQAIKEVLTPEQFERYQKFQEQQIKLIESFMPKSAPGGNNAQATPAVAR